MLPPDPAYFAEVFYCDVAIGSDVPTVDGFFSNGHCFIVLVQTKNARTPKRISSSPHFRAAPVCQKSHAQPIMVNTAGKGYSHILKGSRSVPSRFRKSITPTACPINCTINRTARIPAMEVSKSSLMLKKNARAPSASSEKCGKCFVGCSRPKIGKKFPSSAAEYGTREYPSNTENTEASAIHNTIPVATDAAVCT